MTSTNGIPRRRTTPATAEESMIKINARMNFAYVAFVCVEGEKDL